MKTIHQYLETKYPSNGLQYPYVSWFWYREAFNFNHPLDHKVALITVGAKSFDTLDLALQDAEASQRYYAKCDVLVYAEYCHVERIIRQLKESI